MANNPFFEYSKTVILQTLQAKDPIARIPPGIMFSSNCFEKL